MSGGQPDPRLLEGLRLARAREYFAAHEALEALWQDEPEGPWREALQALIQLCVALEHLRRGNALGAFNVAGKARARLAELEPWQRGVGVGPFAAAVEAFWREAHLADRVKEQLGGAIPSDDAPATPPPPLPPDEAWPIPPLDEALAAAL